VPSEGEPSDCRQALQPSLQAASQHTPSTQKPEAHCAPLLQKPPGGSSAVQLPALHAAPGAHWVEAVHEAGQAAPPVHAYVPQVPDVPAGRLVQVPSALAPSASLHALQPPRQALSQHTPSTQRPEAHCAPLLQAAPSASVEVQLPAVQVAPGAHCDEEEHVVGHAAVPPHA